MNINKNKLCITNFLYDITACSIIILPVIIFILPFFNCLILTKVNDIILVIVTSFIKKIDTFSTIASVLVGIYLSLLLYLTSFEPNSILANLDISKLEKIKRNLERLLVLGTIFMFTPILTNYFDFLNRVIFVCFFYLSFSCIKISLLFSIIISTDLPNRHQRFKNESDSIEDIKKMVTQLHHKNYHD